MHSSTLRSEDFTIRHKEDQVKHAEFFSHVTQATRLGVYAPNGTDGVGATTLIMAYVTAFYNCYREQGGDFFAYPSYYTLQHTRPLASYTMLDIWPQHKDVWVDQNPLALLDAINNRAIDVLLVPEGSTSNPAFERPQLETARQTIKSCYLYAAGGQTTDAELEITVHSKQVLEWSTTIFNDHNRQPITQFASQKEAWIAKIGAAEELTQTFKHITLEDALTRLG